MTTNRRLALLGLALACAYGPAWPSVAWAQDVRVVVDTTYYRTEGRTRREWLASMGVAARGAGVQSPFFAHTSWQTRWWHGPLTLSPIGCAAGAPVVEVTIRYTMPRLVPGSGASQEDLREWRRHLASIWRHEEGHAQRDYRAAVEMRDSLNWVRAPTCADLRARLVRSIDAVSAKYRALNIEYDVRSEHGARQGARLILSGTARRSADTTFRDTMP